MKLVTFTRTGEASHPGVLTDRGIVDLAELGFPAGRNGDLLEIARGGDELLAKVRAAVAEAREFVEPRAARLRAPIVEPGKIIGIGLNYADHCRQANLPFPDVPVLFGKFPNSVVGPGDDIVFSRRICREVDYEAELAFVMGKRASRVAESAALDHVLGYAVANDVSARDLQSRGSKQWDHAKSIDTFCPWGPWLVTRDEVHDPQALDLRLTLNGVEMQKSNTSNMIFGVAQLVAFISQSITLEAGDLILTGTPYGVGFKREPPVYLKDGDECEIEVSGLGLLRNRVREIP
jgi:2-keto-4-pentenoate hydratase/2-oxohepta-3-ene-1,7-dioic acid hydratase in catechol pathway